jgi:tripartite-type tricarboxylate transporter receptor subunit TctC
VPSVAGSGIDIAARELAKALGEQWRTPVIVENKPGAQGMLAADYVAKSQLSERKVLFATSAIAINSLLYRNFTLDPSKDLTPTSLVVEVPLVLVTSPNLPARSVRELVAFAKARPEALHFLSSGVGSSSHLAGELLNQSTGMRLVHVPFKTTASALNAVVGDQSNVMFADASAVLPEIHSGKLRALAVASRTRIAALPDVPTMREEGIPDFDVLNWYGLFLPPRAPAPYVEGVAGEVRKAVQAPGLRSQLALRGWEPVALGPSQFDAVLRTDAATWARVAKAANIKAE